MTESEQQKAIATVCGWTHIENIGQGLMIEIWGGYPPKDAIIGQKQELPNYPYDLNAMHEAEKVLSKEEHRNYIFGYLIGIVGNHRLAYCATAAQRAEAYLRAKGLWKSSTGGEH